MSASQPFRCFIIGETSLSVRCADVLREHGHELLGIVSDNEQVVAWSRESGVEVIDPRSDLTEALRGAPFDYLFSIVNYRVLPQELLELPRIHAINYHDALLPTYAGVYATSWALMNREPVHGVSWHVMTELVDAGPILAQRRIEIGENDRALGLNMKCYDAAVESFREMVEKLGNGTIDPREQDLSKRTYFGMEKRPAAESVIDFDRDAEEIDALARALDFGAAYFNTLALPKFLAGGRLLAAPHVEMLDMPSTSHPGEVIVVEDDGICVATKTRPVKLHAPTELDGRPLPDGALSSLLGLREGDRLSGLEGEAARRIGELAESCARYEPFWVRRLASLRVPDVSYVENVAGGAEAVRFAQLDAALPAEVKNLFDAAPGVPPDQVIAAAFTAFLGRVTDDTGFDVGLGVDRFLADVEGVESFFATRVPLRIDASPDDPLGSYVDRFAKQLKRLRRRKTYARDLVARHPRLNGAHGPRLVPRLPIAIESLEGSGAMRADEGVAVALAVSEDGTRCLWHYDQNAVSDENLARLAGQFRTFVAGLTVSPSTPIAEQPILTDVERRQVLYEWNSDTLDFDRTRAIHQLFEDNVESRPDAVAVYRDGETITYGELGRWVEAIAARLVSEGVRPEEPVGICSARSFEMVAAMLAVHKAGGTYIPLDPAYPEARLTFILEDSGASIVLARREQIGNVPRREGTRIIDLDEMREGGFEVPAGIEFPAADSRRLAFVIYTSGSTGTPKGVGIEHKSVLALAHWTRREFDDEDLSGVLASSSICFDLSVFEILVTLMLGGRVVLVENALGLADLPEEAGVKLINSVPSVMERVLQIEGIAWTVRTFTMAGEFLSTPLVNDLYAKTGAERVFDLYGASEDTTHSTIVLRQPDARATVGKAMANSQIYLLDRRRRPVPVGVVGEIYLGGEGLARGYVGRPELTAERFLKNPFLDDPEARIYRTGDLGRYRPDGDVEYAGRMDYQVKVRGFRIELGEIEAVLEGHEAVREAVALAWDDEKNGGKTLAAYVVSESSADRPSIGDLRRFMIDRVPEYMVPTAWIFLDAFPLTPNGKVDRKALPRTEEGRPELEEGFVEPRDEVETKLAALWEEILGKTPIGVRDDFFDLGGHSLLAVRVFARITEEFGKELPPDTLFHGPTIEKLAEILRQDEWERESETLIPIHTSGSLPPFFVVPPAASPGVVFAPLAKHLGPDQPLYGLTPPDPNNERVPENWFELMATRFIEDIKTVQPEGPYYVGGSCFGAFIAYEIAQQLTRRGDEVAFMAVIDAVAPFSIGKTYKTGLKHRIRALRFAMAHQVIDRIRGSKGEYVLLPGFDVQYLLDEVTRPNASYRQQAWDANLRSASHYIAHPYPGRVTLILSEVNARFPKIRAGWNKLAQGGVDYYEIPGKHIDALREPNVRFAAEKIQRSLGRIPASVEQPSEAAV